MLLDVHAVDGMPAVAAPLSASSFPPHPAAASPTAATTRAARTTCRVAGPRHQATTASATSRQIMRDLRTNRGARAPHPCGVTVSWCPAGQAGHAEPAATSRSSHGVGLGRAVGALGHGDEQPPRLELGRGGAQHEAGTHGRPRQGGDDHHPGPARDQRLLAGPVVAHEPHPRRAADRPRQAVERAQAVGGAPLTQARRGDRPAAPSPPWPGGDRPGGRSALLVEHEDEVEAGDVVGVEAGELGVDPGLLRVPRRAATR